MAVNRGKADHSAPILVLRHGDRAELFAWLQSAAVASNMVLRAQIVLLASQGMSNSEIAENLGVSRPTVISWRRRYQEYGLAGLSDQQRLGRPRRLDHSQIVAATLARPPDELGIGHWSSRSLATRLDVSDTTVAKVWREYGIQPWRSGVFKFTVDPELAATDVDIVGLALGFSSPGDAVVLNVDAGISPATTSPVSQPLQTALARASVTRGAVADDDPDLRTFIAEVVANYPAGDLHVVFDDHDRPSDRSAMSHRRRDDAVQNHSTATRRGWLNLVEVWAAMAQHPSDSAPGHDLDHELRKLIDEWDRHSHFTWTKTDPFSASGS